MKLSMEDVFLFLKDVIQDLNLIIAGFPLATGCHWSPFLGSADAQKDKGRFIEMSSMNIRIIGNHVSNLFLGPLQNKDSLSDPFSEQVLAGAVEVTNGYITIMIGALFFPTNMGLKSHSYAQLCPFRSPQLQPQVYGITGRSVEETEIFALLQSMERLRLDGEGVWEAQTLRRQGVGTGEYA